jgi:hypothetical protein
METDYSYPNINRWMKHLYWEVPGFKETTDFTHIKAHYMTSHAWVSIFHEGLLITDQSACDRVCGTTSAYPAVMSLLHL